MMEDIDLYKLKQQMLVLQQVADCLLRDISYEHDDKKKELLKDKLARVRMSRNAFWVAYDMELWGQNKKREKELTAFCRVCNIVKEYGVAYCPYHENECLFKTKE